MKPKVFWIALKNIPEEYYEATTYEPAPIDVIGKPTKFVEFSAFERLFNLLEKINKEPYQIGMASFREEFVKELWNAREVMGD